MVDKQATFKLDFDKNIIIEGEKIGFTFSIDGFPADIAYRQYYSLLIGFNAADIESFGFAKSPQGLKVTPDGTDGYWDGTGAIFSLVLWRNETSKSFDVVFNRDTNTEIIEGGYISIGSFSYTGYRFDYKYGESGITVLDSAEPKALVELSDSARNEGDAIGSTLIYTGAGNKIYWRVLGVDVGDLWLNPGNPAAVNGEAIVDYTGRILLSHFLANDLKTEVYESFKVNTA